MPGTGWTAAGAARAREEPPRAPARRPAKGPGAVRPGAGERPGPAPGGTGAGRGYFLTVSGSSFLPVGPIWMWVSI